jgi:hypothetical protein
MPSMANGRPHTSPNVRIIPGQRMPSSNDRMVPDTAPTANSTPSVCDHRRARRRASASYLRMPSTSAATTSAGNPTPKQAMTMCQPSDKAICWRAAHSSTCSAARRTTALTTPCLDVVRTLHARFFRAARGARLPRRACRDDLQRRPPPRAGATTAPHGRPGGWKHSKAGAESRRLWRWRIASQLHCLEGFRRRSAYTAFTSTLVDWAKVNAVGQAMKMGAGRANLGCSDKPSRLTR